MIRNIVFDILDVLIGHDGPIHESVDLLMDMKSRGFPLYAVTNMSGESFEDLRRDYPFLRLFDGVVISGNIGLAKPDPEIFRHLLDQFSLDAAETVFIDDKISNATGAKAAGLEAIHFQSPRQLEAALLAHGLLDAAPAQTCGENCRCH